jgi:hypothetical protein
VHGSPMVTLAALASSPCVDVGVGLIGAASESPTRAPGPGVRR